MINCTFCGKPCKSRGLKQHQKTCKLNPNRIAWTNQFVKGTKTSHSAETIEKMSNTASTRKVSDNTRQILRDAMQKAARKHPLSYSGRNGRSKKVQYRGITLDSSWEFKFAKWCDTEFILWEKPTESFEYEWKGKRLYHPDFYLPDFDLFVEVKGFQRDRDVAKWRSVPNLVIVKLKEIQMIERGEFSVDKLTCSSIGRAAAS